jgi:hypothetical protein
MNTTSSVFSDENKPAIKVVVNLLGSLEVVVFLLAMFQLIRLLRMKHGDPAFRVREIFHATMIALALGLLLIVVFH